MTAYSLLQGCSASYSYITIHLCFHYENDFNTNGNVKTFSQCDLKYPTLFSHRVWIQTERTNLENHLLYILDCNRFFVCKFFVWFFFCLSIFYHLILILSLSSMMRNSDQSFPPSDNTLGNFQTSGSMAVMPQDLFSLKEIIE